MILEWEVDSDDHLDTILEAWSGTPYRLGSQRKGLGVDCVRFVSAVMDELHFGEIRGDHSYLPPDRALHDPQSAWLAMRKVIRRYGDVDFLPYLPDEEGPLRVSPGDALITGPAGGGPGHCMIVGNRPYLWHSLLNYGVCFTGAAFHDGTQLFGRYRKL